MNLANGRKRYPSNLRKKENAMKQRTRGLLPILIFICVSALGQNNAWETSIQVGKDAMERRQYSEAEKSFREAFTIVEKFGEKDARYSGSLMFLAQACDGQSKKDEAEALTRRAVLVMEEALKAYQPKTTEGHLHASDIAALLFDQAGGIFAGHQNYPEAETLYKRAIKIRVAAAEENDSLKHGADENHSLQNNENHPLPLQNNEEFFEFGVRAMFGSENEGKLMDTQEKLARLYFTEHKFQEAAATYEKVRSMRERFVEPAPDESEETWKQYLAKHKLPEEIAAVERTKQLRAQLKQTGQHDLALTLSNLASCYAAQANYDKARPLYQRALALFEQANGMEKPEAISTMQLYALLLKKTGREADANAMLEKASAIKKRLAQPIQ
ncbi:MAG TPA: tetratricopeptide repeat protein [Candidatus Angelobacter sp.]|nr:tetratricopeptide repeat protein [Candidatus Angelobacter sp.]